MNRSNDDKLDLFADLLEPVAVMLADDNVTGVIKRGEPAIRVVRNAIKLHKDQAIEILARLEGVEPDEYEFDGMRVTMKLLGYFNRPDVQKMVNELFTSPRKSADGASSGAATENTGDGAN